MANRLHQLWRQFERHEKFQSMAPEQRVRFVDYVEQRIRERVPDQPDLERVWPSIRKRYAVEAGLEQPDPEPTEQTPRLPHAGPVTGRTSFGKRTEKAFKDRLKAIAQNRLSYDALKKELDDEYANEVEQGPDPDRPGLVSGIVGALTPTLAATAGATALTGPVGGLATAGGIEAAANRLEATRDAYFTLLDQGVKDDEAYQRAVRSGLTSGAIHGAAAAIPLGGQAAAKIGTALAGTRTGVARFATETGAKAAVNAVENAAAEGIDIVQETARGIDLSERRGTVGQRLAINAAVGAGITGAVSVGSKLRTGNFNAETEAGRFAAVQEMMSLRATDQKSADQLAAEVKAGQFKDSVDPDKDIAEYQQLIDAVTDGQDPQVALNVTGDNVPGTLAAWKRKAGEIEFYNEALRGTEETRVRTLTHEVAHPYQDSLDPKTQSELFALFLKETSEQTGPLYTRPDADAPARLRDGLEYQIEDHLDLAEAATTRSEASQHINTAYREWFAERMMLANHEWATGRVNDAKLTGFAKIASKFRKRGERVGRALGFGDDINNRFRDFFDRGAKYENKSADVIRELADIRAAQLKPAPNPIAGPGQKALPAPKFELPNRFRVEADFAKAAKFNPDIRRNQAVDFTEPTEFSPSIGTATAAPTRPPEAGSARTPDPALSPVRVDANQTKGEGIDQRRTRVAKELKDRYPKQKTSLLEAAVKRAETHARLDDLLAKADAAEVRLGGKVSERIQPEKASERIPDEAAAIKAVRDRIARDEQSGKSLTLPAAKDRRKLAAEVHQQVEAKRIALGEEKFDEYDLMSKRGQISREDIEALGEIETVLDENRHNMLADFKLEGGYEGAYSRSGKAFEEQYGLKLLVDKDDDDFVVSILDKKYANTQDEFTNGKGRLAEITVDIIREDDAPDRIEALYTSISDTFGWLLQGHHVYRAMRNNQWDEAKAVEELLTYPESQRYLGDRPEEGDDLGWQEYRLEAQLVIDDTVDQLGFTPDMKLVSPGVAMYSEVATVAQVLNVENLAGTVVGGGALGVRLKLFPDTEVKNITTDPADGKRLTLLKEVERMNKSGGLDSDQPFAPANVVSRIPQDRLFSKRGQQAARKAGYTVGPVHHFSTAAQTKNLPINRFREKDRYGDRVGTWFTDQRDYIENVLFDEVSRKKQGEALRFTEAMLRPGKTIDLRELGEVTTPREMAKALTRGGLPTRADDLPRPDRSPTKPVKTYIPINMWGQLVDRMDEHGIDTLILSEQDGASSYFVRDPRQIKSAADETVDDAGKPVPPAARFNPESDDIRFSKRGQKPSNRDLTKSDYWLLRDGNILPAEGGQTHAFAAMQWTDRYDRDTNDILYRDAHTDTDLYEIMHNRLGWVRVARMGGGESMVYGPNINSTQRRVLQDAAIEEGHTFQMVRLNSSFLDQTIGPDSFSKRGQTRRRERAKKTGLPAPPVRQFAERGADKYSKQLGEIFEKRDDIAFRDPQNLRDIQKESALKTDDELDKALNTLETKTEESKNNTFIMDGLEALNRALTKDDEAGYTRAYEVLSKAGTSIGQMLRQFREFKGKAARLNLMKLVELALTRAGRKMTAPQKAKLQEIIDADLKAKDELETKAEEYFEDPTNADKEKAAFDAAYKEDRAFREMQAHVRARLPRKLSQLPMDFLAAIQGNLLTPVSTMRNLEGNYINYALRLPGRLPAATMDAALHKSGLVQDRSVKLPSFRELGWFLQGSYRGLAKARDAFTLGARNDVIIGETIRGFNPVKALIEAFTGDLPVDVNTGRVRLTDRFNKLIEGTFGFFPEGMLRTLSSMDELAKEGFRSARLAEEVDLRNLEEGSREFAEVKFSGASQPHLGREFSGDRRAQAVAEEAALKQTFQDKSGAASVAQGIENALASQPVIGPALRVAYRVAVSPYVRTPINLTMEGMKLAIPMFGFMHGAAKAMQGNRREAMLSFGYAITGMVMGSMVNALLEDDLVSPGPENGKTTKMRQDSGMGFFRLNVSGLGRKLRGEDPSYRVGDYTIRLDTLGIFGYVAAVKAEGRQEVEKDPKAVSEIPKVVTDQLGGLMAAGRFAMNQTMLQGAADGIRALAQGEGSLSRWVGNFFNVVTSAVMPNSLVAWNNIHEDTRKETLDKDSPYRSALNVLTHKAGVLEAVATDRHSLLDSLPDKLDMWGRPVRPTPEGQNPFVWHMLDVFKTEKVRADASARLFKIHQDTGNDDFIPTMVPRNLNHLGVDVNLPPHEYADMVKSVQGAKLEVFKRLVTSQSWQRIAGNNPDNAANIMRTQYTRAGRIAKLRWINRNRRRLDELAKELKKLRD